MEERLKLDFEKTLKNLSFSKKEIETKQNYLSRFLKVGLPNRNLENWKFSDLSQIIKKSIGELSFYNDYSSLNKVDNSIFVDGLEHNKIVFINGRVEKIDFQYEEKNKIDILEGIELNDNFKNINSLVNLNNAFTNKHFKIIVKNNYSLKKPLIIYHSTNKKIKAKNVNIRLDFLLEQNSCLKIIDIFNDASEKNFVNV